MAYVDAVMIVMAWHTVEKQRGSDNPRCALSCPTRRYKLREKDISFKNKVNVRRKIIDGV